MSAKFSKALSNARGRADLIREYERELAAMRDELSKLPRGFWREVEQTVVDFRIDPYVYQAKPQTDQKSFDDLMAEWDAAGVFDQHYYEASPFAVVARPAVSDAYMAELEAEIASWDEQPTAQYAHLRVKLPKPTVKLVAKTPKAPTARKFSKNWVAVFGLVTFAVVMLLNVALSVQ